MPMVSTIAGTCRILKRAPVINDSNNARTIQNIMRPGSPKPNIFTKLPPRISEHSTTPPAAKFITPKVIFNTNAQQMMVGITVWRNITRIVRELTILPLVRIANITYTSAGSSNDLPALIRNFVTLFSMHHLPDDSVCPGYLVSGYLVSGYLAVLPGHTPSI
jgi:hypothetical protein